VADVQVVHSALTAQNHDLWMAFPKDPDGNVLELMSEVSRD
jgi:hypothetical protein